MKSENYILSIEDNTTDIALMTRIFERRISDYAIRHISDGETAVDFIESDGFKKQSPKLILLDIKVPKLDGLEVLRQFRKHKEYKTIPVVMMSSSDLNEDKEKAYLLGANSFITKPKTFLELCETLPSLINNWII
ncbi:CheY-like chemotaxis protein [Leeuwenhoekiella aestuarii]|uniref:CheY-like chemotaxis protein n=1 Tax=Leeuwenhoekiella aestuarii TaxID=2249426 RepID=A0A4Q0NVY2_9FLAO|nr:response regulator [Leeuwenhoekiella aestuarii]RXG15708.1 CheY-like chemotaxis protein [Leeuwenhoekiella aestuarii]RXG17183.1 CheY-like chemotaxis protein [Leeuwenhoekiella aestuarii]